MSLLKKIKIIAADNQEKEIIERALQEIAGGIYFNGKGKVGARLETPYPRDMVVFFPLDNKSEINHFALRSGNKRTFSISMQKDYALLSPPNGSLISGDLFDYKVEYSPKSA